MIITRTWAMPNSRTFTIPPIKSLVEDYVLSVPENGTIVDPFACSCQYGTITNDLNPEYSTDFHMDALEFLKTRGDEEADLVLYDPPYSITQASQMYKSFGKDKLEINVSNMKYWSSVKNEISRILKRGGVCISCGWNTNGLGKGRGFETEKIMIVCHGGSKNDTLVTVERKWNESV